jgi:hypothetical protein
MVELLGVEFTEESKKNGLAARGGVVKCWRWRILETRDARNASPQGLLIPLFKIKG